MKLEIIYNKQEELMKKYHKIEKANGFLHYEEVPMNINHPQAQARIKDFCWRFTEELAEALIESDEANMILYREELVDCLHFLTELSISVDFRPKDMKKKMTDKSKEDTLDLLFEYAQSYLYRGHNRYTLAMSVIKNLGLMANELKNRPWKQLTRITDKKIFYAYLMNTWRAFIRLCLEAGFTADLLYEGYVSKSNINKTRQKEGY